MKFLDAQRLPARAPAADRDSKMLPSHANKMQPPHPTKSDTDSGSAEVMSEEVQALAASLGVDLSTVTGTGKGGRVLQRDVRAAATANAAKLEALIKSDESNESNTTTEDSALPSLSLPAEGAEP